MKISQTDMYHGAALLQLHKYQPNHGLVASPHKRGYFSSDHIGLTLKYSTSKTESWSFTFREDELNHLFTSLVICNRAFLVLICGCVPGPVLLNKTQIAALLDLDAPDEQQSIRVTRQPQRSPMVTGHTGERLVIALNAFPRFIFD